MSNPNIGRLLALTVLLGLAAPVTGLGVAAGQDQDHRQGHHAGLHFTHPMIAESVSPDTKVRFDHQFTTLADGDETHLGSLEIEYAFLPAFSIETGLPYSYTDGVAGNLEAALKFANFALEEHGILLGYGVEIGFPTAGDAEEDDDGEVLEAAAVGASRPVVFRSSTGGGFESEWELSPFLNVGLKRGRFEIVAWGRLGIPFALGEEEEPKVELGYDLAALYHATSRIDVLLELDGTGGVSGEAVGEDVVNLSPGVRFQLLADQPLVLGTSVGFPLTDEEGFEARFTTSIFWHF